MGRPSKLTPERQKKLVQAIAAGNYYETACTYAGVDYSTFRLWMQAGEKAKSGKFFELFEAITHAETEAEMRAVVAWQKAFPDDWRAAKDFLERRHRDRWGPVQKMEVDQRMSGTVEVDHGVDIGSANALLIALGFDAVGAVEPGDASIRDAGDSTPAPD